MVSRAEHARRTIAKLKARLAKTRNAAERRDLEARLALWRQHLEIYRDASAADVQSRAKDV